MAIVEPLVDLLSMCQSYEVMQVTLRVIGTLLSH